MKVYSTVKYNKETDSFEVLFHNSSFTKIFMPNIYSYTNNLPVIDKETDVSGFFTDKELLEEVRKRKLIE